MASFDLADLVPDSAASGDVSAALGGTATMGDAGGMFQALSGMQADMHDTASDVLTNVR